MNDAPNYPTTIVLNGLLSLREAVEKLGEGKPVVFTEEQKQKIYTYIQEHQQTGKEARLVHKENVIAIKEAKEEEKAKNLCPYCKIPLVLRKGKKGEFYGCNNFPKCRYTKSVE